METLTARYVHGYASTANGKINHVWQRGEALGVSKPSGRASGDAGAGCSRHVAPIRVEAQLELYPHKQRCPAIAFAFTSGSTHCREADRVTLCRDAHESE